MRQFMRLLILGKLKVLVILEFNNKECRKKKVNILPFLQHEKFYIPFRNY